MSGSSRNILLITVDQWRGDSLSVVGHPIVRTPALDRLADQGVLFRNHWANAAPCGPSRASLYTGTYMHHHRSVANGTPLSANFTNIALLAREIGYVPVLFGYTDTSVDPATVSGKDPALSTYEGVLPGFTPIVHDPFEAGSQEWGKWLQRQGVDVPRNPRDLYRPLPGFPGAEDHGTTWAPSRFTVEQSETAFMVEEVCRWLDRRPDRPFFVHASFIRPHPPRRNPVGFHDLYNADDIPEFVGSVTKADEVAAHPLNAVMNLAIVGAPEGEGERRQMRATYYGAQTEVDSQLGRLFDYLDTSGLAEETLVIVTSDHGEMGGDHWLFEKLGYWDETFHIPLIIRDPYSKNAAGRVVQAFTESVDVLPTICHWLGRPIPLQADGASLMPFLATAAEPEHWRAEAHFEWDFRHYRSRLGGLGAELPMAHASLQVLRGAESKYVQFSASADVLPPICFDLSDDPYQMYDLVRYGDPRATNLAWRMSERLNQWRMRNDDRSLSGVLLTAEKGMVQERDTWW